MRRVPHRETTAHFIATGLPSQQNRSDNAFRFKCAAFYMGLKFLLMMMMIIIIISKVGLVAAKASALRINLNIQGCSVPSPNRYMAFAKFCFCKNNKRTIDRVAPSLHAPSLAPLLLPLLFTQYPSPPRSLVRDGQTSSHRPLLVVSRSTCPPLSTPPLPRTDL